MTKLKDTFIELAIKHGEAIDSGDYKIANKLHSKLSKLFDEIKQEELWTELKEIMQHSNNNVKLWAATFLLKNDPNLALEVLNELKESKEIIGLTATTTIDMWKKGMLNLL